MATYAIYTPDQPGKFRGRFQANTRAQAIAQAMALVWSKDARVMGVRRLSGGGRWRITVRLWNQDNTARYESAILVKGVQDESTENTKHRSRGLEARLLD